MPRSDPSVEPRAPMDFGGHCLVGKCSLDSLLLLPETTYLGLRKETSAIYGTWRDTDGNLLRAIRGIGAGSSDYRFLFTSRPGHQLVRAEDDESGLWRGAVEITTDGERVRFAGPQASFAFDHEPDSCRWADGDAIDVTGSLLGPGMHWFSTWDGGACYSVSAKYRTSGRVLDRRVEGFVGHEIHYFSPGANWLDSPYGRGREICWQQVANEYEDGSQMYGTFAVGTDGWGFAMVQEDGSDFVCSTDVACEASVGENGYPAQITYRFAGQSWTWRIDPQGERPQILEGSPMRGADGTCTRDGDDRAVRFSMGNSDWWTDGRADPIIRPEGQLR